MYCSEEVIKREKKIEEEALHQIVIRYIKKMLKYGKGKKEKAFNIYSKVMKKGQFILFGSGFYQFHTTSH